MEIFISFGILLWAVSVRRQIPGSKTGAKGKNET
jgi:hypothetical protein